jgi:hypothetical protein
MLIVIYILSLYFLFRVTVPFLLQSNNKVAKDNLVLVSAGQWIYAVSSIDGVISWGKEFTLDGYA